MSAESAVSPLAIPSLELPGDIAASGARIGKWLVGSIMPGLMATGVVLDHRAAQNKWSRTEPTITGLPLEHGALKNVGIIGKGGFNNDPSRNMQALQPTLSRFGRTAIFNDSQGSLSIEQNSETIIRWTKKHDIDTVVLLGFSQGTMLNVLEAPTLRQAGLDLRIGIDSSPFEFEDVKSETTRKVLKILAGLHQKRKYGGPLLRLGLETFGYIIDHKGEKHTLRPALANAREKARLEGTHSNKQCLSRADLLVNADLTPSLAQLRGVPMMYWGAALPENDPVIDNDASHAKYETALGETIPRLTRVNYGHANPADFAEAGNEMAEEAMLAFDISSAENRRSRIFLHRTG